MFNVSLKIIMFITSFLTIVAGSKGKHGLLEYCCLSLIATVLAWTALQALLKGLM